MNKWILLGVLLCVVNAERIRYLETLSLPQLSKFSKRDTTFSVDFKAHDRTFQLDLERHTGIFSDDLVFEYEAEGEIKAFDFDTSVYYKGKARMGSDEGTFSLRLDEDTQSLHGVIVGNQENWMLESSSLHGSHDEPMVIYKWSDVEEHEAPCGVTAQHEHKQNITASSHMQQLRNVHSLRQAQSTCTIGLIADSRIFQAFGSKVFNILQLMVDTMTNIETIYRNQNIGGFQIVGTRVYTDPATDPFVGSATNAEKFLNAVGTQVRNVGPANKCLVHGFTHAEWNGPVGLAWVGHTCNPGGGSGVSTSYNGANRPPNGVRFLTIVTGHEIGHNFGANHDGADIPNFIMAPAVSTQQKRIFSQFSLDQFAQRRNSGGFSCFINKPSVFGTCGNGWLDAGEQCDCGTSCANDNFCTAQCTLKSGAQCTPANGPCCGSNGQFLAKGTSCGPSPVAGVSAPTCEGGSALCPDCWPAGTHPNIYSNIIPCDLKRDCKAGCAFDNTPTRCQSCRGIGEITEENLPDGSCCSIGRCRAGVCVATTPQQTSNSPTPTSNAPTPTSNPPPTCSTPSPVGTGSSLIGRYYSGTNFNTLIGNRNDPTINFDLGTRSPANGVPADNFSVRWTGQVQPRFSGQWTFTITSDDGSRLWVNNIQLINDFVAHSRADRSGSINLVAGTKYNIKMEYFEGSADAVAILRWAHSCQPQQVIPSTQLYPVEITTNDEGCAGYEGEGQGLNGKYTDSNGTVVIQQTEGPIDQRWMGVPSGFGDKLNIVWEGYLQPRFSEEYTFFTNSSSGVRLTIDGKLIINNWVKHAITEDSGKVVLEGGKGVSIKLEYFHEGLETEEGLISLMWQSTKCQAKELIGKPFLYTSLDLIPTDDIDLGGNSGASLMCLVSLILFALF
eukprot:TRINITY_DN3062_c0_g1_i1.p1 TRINITY_DN3062_c0_g1~~TRINITY_DN3062_c0_g1_i1.p1  ORF type:complete len:905 (+),score=258.59 TRINITY_DN3062_c0_g1_i1:29-2716(+)